VLPAARVLLAVALAFVVLLVPARARAEDPGDGLPIVTSGREAEIQSLAAPYALQKAIAPGWTFADIAISATTIRFIARGPGSATATLRLEHPDRAPSGERTASFALHRETSAGGAGEPPSPGVLDPLAVAVRANDTGRFWPAPRPIAPGRGQAGGAGSRKVVEVSPRWELTLRRKLLIGGLVASLLLLLVSRLRAGTAAG
jgi:hypothetical protein